MIAGRRIRVLIVDDSAIVRKVLSDALSGEPDLDVVGAVPDAMVARARITELQPDVLTVDIEMPQMDGISFVRELMATNPIPCIIISSVAQSGCERALQALEAGAVEVLAKPSGPYSVGDLKRSLPEKIRAAAQARVRRTSGSVASRKIAKAGSGCSARKPVGAIIAMGASTGGTEAVREVLEALPGDCPPVLIVQHIPAVFSKSFARRLNERCAMTVREAQDGGILQPGVALVAPGDFHMLVRHSGLGLQIRLSSGPRVCYQRPSVDVLFQSIAQIPGLDSLGLILTGMGNDGAAGLKQMREAGACTIAQDELSSVVYGMPREAARLGAAQRVLPLRRIGSVICDWFASLGDKPADVIASCHGS